MKKLPPERVARMTPESRKKYEERLRTLKRNRIIIKFFIAVIIIGLATYLLFTNVLFKVKRIEVANIGNYYTAQEIIKASGINIGDRITNVDLKAMEGRITEQLPYILSVKTNNAASGNIVINAKDDEAAVIYSIENGYALADKYGKVLEVSETVPEGKNLIVLVTSENTKAEPGKKIGFASEDENELYISLIEAFDNAGLNQITEVDMSDTTNIYAKYNNKFKLHIGTPSDLNDKAKTAAQIIKSEEEKNPNELAEINLTVEKKAFVTPLESLD